MGDLATLLGGLGTFGTFATSSIALVITWIRSSKKERKHAATDAADRAVEQVLDEIIADGEITADELAKLRELRAKRHHRKEVEEQ